MPALWVPVEPADEQRLIGGRDAPVTRRTGARVLFPHFHRTDSDHDRVPRSVVDGPRVWPIGRRCDRQIAGAANRSAVGPQYADVAFTERSCFDTTVSPSTDGCWSHVVPTRECTPDTGPQCPHRRSQQPSNVAASSPISSVDAETTTSRDGSSRVICSVTVPVVDVRIELHQGRGKLTQAPKSLATRRLIF